MPLGGTQFLVIPTSPRIRSYSKRVDEKRRINCINMKIAFVTLNYLSGRRNIKRPPSTLKQNRIMSLCNSETDTLREHPLVPYFIPENLTEERIKEEKKRLLGHYSTSKMYGLRGNCTYQFRVITRTKVTSDFCRNCMYRPSSGEYDCTLDRHSSLLYPPLPEYEATPKGWVKKGE